LQRSAEVAFFTFNGSDFGKRQDFYVWVPADLDQFRCQNSHRAVIGWKGLIELGHVAANARPLLNQVDLESSSGQVQGCLDTTDTTPDNQDISEISAAESFRKWLQFLSWQYVVSQFLSPHQLNKRLLAIPFF